jgi:hypothetical protein
MANGLAKVLADLRGVDLRMAAFELTTTLSGGVYPTEMQQALQLFVRIPCPETAMVLISVCPEAAGVMALSTGSFAANLPKEMRGPKYDGLEEWMASFEENEKASDAIHRFLLEGALAGTIQVGFHRLRDQQILFHRLGLIGLRKGWFRNPRQYLRDTITREISAFRVVTDLVCIHGVAGGRERFWSPLGAEGGPELHLHSEVQYALRGNADGFIRLVNTFPSATEDEA